MAFRVKTFQVKAVGLNKIEQQFEDIDKHVKAISQFKFDMKGSKDIKKMSADIRKLNTEVAKLSKSNSKLTDKEKEARVESKKLRSELKVLTSEHKKLQKGVKATSNAEDKAKKSTNEMGKSMRFAFKVAAYATFFRFLVRGIRSATDETAAFNRQTRIAGLISSGGAGAQAEVNTLALRAEALRIGGQTEYTAQQIAELEVAYGKLGFTAEQTLSLIGTTANAATVAQEDLALTAEVVGNAIHAFGFEAEDAGRVADVMAKSFTSSALNLQKFKVGVATAGSSARAANVPFEKTVAMLAVLSDAGFEASKSATSLRNILLISQTEGEDYNTILKEIAGSQRQLAEASSHFGRRAAAAAVILGIEAERVKSLNEQFIGATGFSKETAEAIRGDLQGSLDRFRSTLKNLIIVITTEFSPTIKSVLDWAVDFGTAITQLVTGLGTFDQKILDIKKRLNELRYQSLKGVGGFFSVVISSVAPQLNPWLKYRKNVLNNNKRLKDELFAQEQKSIDDKNAIIKGDIKENIKQYKHYKETLVDILNDETATPYRGAEWYKLYDEILRMDGVIKEIGDTTQVASAKTKSELIKLYANFDNELGNAAIITEKRSNEIVRSISNLLKADNLLPESEQMGEYLRKRFLSLITKAGDAAYSSSKTVTDSISENIKALFEQRKGLGENKDDERALLDEKIRDLQARLERIKFVAEPIVGIVNKLNKELKDLNEEFGKSLNKDDQDRIAKLIAEGNTKLKEINNIKLRATASADPNLTGVIKEDQLDKYKSVYQAYTDLVADIESSDVSASDRRFQLAEANRIRQNAEFELDLLRFEENSIEWQKIVAKIRANDVASDKEGNKVLDKKSIESIQAEFDEKRASAQATLDAITGKSAKDERDRFAATRALKRVSLEEDVEIARKKLENARQAGEDTVELQRDIDARLAALRKSDLDDAKKTSKEKTDDIKRVIGDIGDWVSNVEKATNAIFESGFAKDDRDTAKIEKSYEDRIKAAKGNNRKQAILEKQRDAELEKIDRRRFERQKKKNIAQALIQGSQAILALLAAAPGFADIGTFGVARAVSIALTAATVAAQVSNIKQTEYPGFFHGGDTGNKVLYKDKDGRGVVGVVHRNEHILEEKLLKTKEGQDLRAKAEVLRRGGKIGQDLSISPSNIVVDTELEFSRQQLEYLAVNTSMAVREAMKTLALEQHMNDDMAKRAG